MSLRAIWHRLVGTGKEPFDDGAPGQDDASVTAWLDAAGLPWRATRAELAARFGIGKDNPYQWPIVSLDVRPPPLDGLLWPFGFQAFPRFDTARPPERLSTHVSVGNDAEANIRHAARQLGQHLGTQAVRSQWNTRKVVWRGSKASVTLTAWPAAMQSGPKLANPAHVRDPRLDTACSVQVRTGWRPPVSAPERFWLSGFVPMGPVRNWDARPLPGFAGGPFNETLLGFMRDTTDAPPCPVDVFGLSADKAALIVSRDELFILPLARVSGFVVTRTLPAKGGGGSKLSATFDTGLEASPTGNMPVARGARADDLNDLAARLAEATGKKLRLEDYDYDT